MKIISNKYNVAYLKDLFYYFWKNNIILLKIIHESNNQNLLKIQPNLKLKLVSAFVFIKDLGTAHLT